MITDMLADVTRRGTARRAKGSFKNVAIAGKTGTSRDGWFVGYTPNLVCAVWIGFDDNKQLGLTGADAALPAWIDFMQEALAVRPSLGGSSFVKPRGITSVKIDPETGFLAGPTCPSSQTVNVSAQFAPIVECLEHRPDEPELIYEKRRSRQLRKSWRDSSWETVRLKPGGNRPDENLIPTAENSRLNGKPKRAANSGSYQTATDVDRQGRSILITVPSGARQSPKPRVDRP